MFTKKKTQMLLIIYTLFIPFIHLLLLIIRADIFFNKLAVLFMLILLFYYEVECLRTCKYKILSFDFAVAVLVISSVLVSGISVVINLDFYGLLLLLTILTVFIDQEILDQTYIMFMKYEKILCFLCYIFFFVVLFYYAIGQGTDVEGYLRGPFSLPHVLAYYCLVIYTMAYIAIKAKGGLCISCVRWNIIKGFAIFICVVTAVRSALLALMILVLCDFIRIKSQRIKASIITVGILAIILSLFFIGNNIENIPVVKKTIEAFSAGSITNGRERFATYILDYYAKDNFIHKVFGSSIAQIRNIMYGYVNIAIHAHNDFVNVLVGYGVVNLFFLLIAWIRIGKKQIGIMGLLFFGILMFFNGVYMYIGFVQCIPLLIIFLRDKKRKRS